MLEIKGLHKKYGKFVALDHIDLQVGQGQIFGFVGPNGAGKTTTMRILSTLMSPTSGDAFIDGVSVRKNPKEIRKKIGYMPDFFGVYDDLKVSEYLDFYGAAAGLTYKERQKNEKDLLELVYLTDKRDAYVDKLSRGMKQRLCLARTLIGNPKLLILDEPASGMDPRARIEMKDILKTLKEMKKTILISSHILPELAELCDIFGIMEFGKFKFVGDLAGIGAKMHGGKILGIKVLERADELVTCLHQVPILNNVQRNEDKIKASFTGADTDIPKLLQYLIAQGYPIMGYGIEQENLEKVFMEVTKDV